VVGIEPQQQHAQGAGALRLGLAMQMKGMDRRGGCFLFLRRGGFSSARLRHSLQQLPRVLKVAPPQQRGAPRRPKR